MQSSAFSCRDSPSNAHYNSTIVGDAERDSNPTGAVARSGFRERRDVERLVSGKRIIEIDSITKIRITAVGTIEPDRWIAPRFSVPTNVAMWGTIKNGFHNVKVCVILP